MAALLDCGAATNAVLDDKPRKAEALCRARRTVERAGMGVCVAEYLRRLEELGARGYMTQSEFLKKLE